MDRSKYPPNWDEVSLAVRVRAGWKCEWCGVADRSRGQRDQFDAWRDEAEIEAMGDAAKRYFFEKNKLVKAEGKLTVVIIRNTLTVHHIGVPKPDGSAGDPHDKMDCRSENLVALCNRCHLLADRDTHTRSRLRTTAKKKIMQAVERVAKTGQRMLWEKP